MNSAGGNGNTRAPGTPRRPSPGVARRRRIVVAVLALILLGGLVWGGIMVAGLFRASQPTTGTATTGTAESAAPTSAAPTTPTPTGSAEPTESTTTAGPVCDPAGVTVLASADSESYPADRQPVFTLTVTNTGDAECTVNVGTSQMEFLISSGGDRIFSSLDCQEGAQDLEKTIPPGGTETAEFTWPRLRSVPGCEAVEALPSSGEYELVTKLGERVSEPTGFTLE